MLLNAHPTHVSVTVAVVSVPVIGLWMEICLPQIGLLLGFVGLFIRSTERATIASPFWLVMPQEPGTNLGVSISTRRIGFELGRGI